MAFKEFAILIGNANLIANYTGCCCLFCFKRLYVAFIWRIRLLVTRQGHVRQRGHVTRHLFGLRGREDGGHAQ